MQCLNFISIFIQGALFSAGNTNKLSQKKTLCLGSKELAFLCAGTKKQLIPATSLKKKKI